MGPPQHKPTEADVQASVRRVRRGCYGSALVIISLIGVYTLATGNLALLLLLLLPIGMIVLARNTN